MTEFIGFPLFPSNLSYCKQVNTLYKYENDPNKSKPVAIWQLHSKDYFEPWLRIRDVSDELQISLDIQ